MKASIFLAAGALALSGCGLGGPAYRAPPAGVAATVDMTIGLKYAPPAVTIYAGQTVEWRNQSPFHHTVTNDPADAERARDAALPAGAQPFNSGYIDPGQVFRHTFTVPGTYRYFCDPHEGQGMVGTIYVRPRA